MSERNRSRTYLDVSAAMLSLSRASGNQIVVGLDGPKAQTELPASKSVTAFRLRIPIAPPLKPTDP